MPELSSNPISQTDTGYPVAKADNTENTAIDHGSIERVLPRQVSTGVNRGTQTVMGQDGTQIQIGNINNTTEFGISVIDKDGFILFKLVGQTWFWYDKTTNKNVMQVGKLPDGTYSMAIAKPGNDVDDAFNQP